MGERKLVLFDVDGTLTEGGYGHFRQLNQAFTEVCGRPVDIRDFNVQGGVEKGAAIHIFKHFGFSEKEIEQMVPKLFRAEKRLFLKCLETAELKALPGVKELLQKLRKMDCRLGLVTGNSREVAFAKLKNAGIADYFQLGGFGDKAVQRPELIELALREAKEKFNESYSGRQIVIVGDTRHDIDSGKPLGCKTIAVLTGGIPEEKFKKSSPDYLFKDLTDTEKAVEAIFND